MGGEEDGHLHHPRRLPHQDPDKTCHKGRCEDDVRQGDQGEGKASEDNCESLPSGCTEETDLRSVTWLHSASFQRSSCRGNPMEWAWETQCWVLTMPLYCTVHPASSAQP